MFILIKVIYVYLRDRLRDFDFFLSTDFFLLSPLLRLSSLKYFFRSWAHFLYFYLSFRLSSRSRFLSSLALSLASISASLKGSQYREGWVFVFLKRSSSILPGPDLKNVKLWFLKTKNKTHGSLSDSDSSEEVAYLGFADSLAGRFRPDSRSFSKSRSLDF